MKLSAQKFIESKIKDLFTFNAFDTKQQYPIWMIAEWMDEFVKINKPTEDPDGTLSVESIKDLTAKYIENEYPGRDFLELEIGHAFKNYSMGLQEGYILGKKLISCKCCGKFLKVLQEEPARICMNPECDEYCKVQANEDIKGTSKSNQD